MDELSRDEVDRRGKQGTRRSADRRPEHDAMDWGCRDGRRTLMAKHTERRHLRGGERRRGRGRGERRIQWHGEQRDAEYHGGQPPRRAERRHRGEQSRARGATARFHDQAGDRAGDGGCRTGMSSPKKTTEPPRARD
jgi:hypothetical protein